MFSCILSPFSNKWGNSFLLPEAFSAVIVWTEQSWNPRRHEEGKAESSLWWLSGEFSFQVHENGLCNSNNFKKKKGLRVWSFPTANSWQIFPRGNPCLLKSSSKHLQYCSATHCHEKKKVLFLKQKSASVFPVSDEVCSGSQWEALFVAYKGDWGGLNAFTGMTTRTKHLWVIAKQPVFPLHTQPPHGYIYVPWTNIKVSLGLLLFVYAEQPRFPEGII